MPERERKRKCFSDIWESLHPDSNEIAVKKAAGETGLTEDAIRARLRKGRGARGRQLRVGGKKRRWVVERDSLAPPHLSRRPGKEKPIKRREDREAHLARARRRAGLGDDWMTTEQAARYIGASTRSTVRHRLQRGTAEGRKIGKEWLVEKASLEPLDESKRTRLGTK